MAGAAQSERGETHATEIVTTLCGISPDAGVVHYVDNSSPTCEVCRASLDARKAGT